MAGGVTDRDRAAVYAAEDQWSAALDRGGLMDFFGSSLELPVQLRFGELEAMQAYIDLRAVEHPEHGSVRVRVRRGAMKAHYDEGVIAIPAQSWACRESVLLHEFAHHLNRGHSPAHGAAYRRVMLDLSESVLGEQAAFLLRTCYEANGVGSVA